ncbi:hypothetical protein D6C86_04222 [Aureobasidium pullulans]|uniref:Nucleotide-diphospho-sugar transferase n=1 Tax=Aureobasidium pullulans TaxID=5580 RepID=A0A4S9W9X0_AURPU|nr:hypothetical protein D6C94_04299 [Aureobasidium pullulans]THZ43199.1 hypothetical protein D6C87_04450 [Aureobasidium pullulans]THZ61598.1 hypothetical protein D6C86_04222 [Aureobasidium pullulans]THZ89741.1 hypothetical protein D6C88_04611 [Aureobasidium pullulans]
MTTGPRMFGSHDYHDKRDDDLRKRPSQAWSWATIMRLRRRRLAMGVLGAFLVWLFIHNIPTDLGSVDQRMGRPLRPGHRVGGVEFGYIPPARPAQQNSHPNPASNKEPTGPPPKSQAAGPHEDHYYAGPVRFYKLAKTIQSIARTMGHRKDNRNVLFAASNLKSAANLLPMACEMARIDKNFVHFTLVGREAIPLEEVLEINAVDGDSCDIFFHDARCDYSEYSTDARAEASVVGALGHINTYMHPQAIIIDDSSVEDAFFIRGLRSKLANLATPLIEIPKGNYEDFLWMTRLDSGGLASWHKPSVNILIHAQPHSSGSLLRLLHSIKTADYSGLSHPEITIDLPPDVESFARDYLRDFEWPPHQDPTGPRQRNVKVHHRISTAKTTTENNALRFLESFYPVDPDRSHVLLLSTQAELSPLYYQYLMYHILQHRYAAYGSDDGDNLFGIVLAAPDTYLNGTSPFRTLSLSDTERKSKDSEDLAAPFLWQAPNSDAALIFGDIWAEVHDYLKNRLRAAHDASSVHQPPTKRAKLLSETQPGWLEYMLELMRARGWRNHYPAQLDAGAWATVHRDLFQKPEEYMSTPQKIDELKETKEEDKAGEEEPFLRAESAAAQIRRQEEYLGQKERDMLQHSQPLHVLLPYETDLTEIGHLPALEYSGQKIEREEFGKLATEFRPLLRAQVGGCNAAEASNDRKYDLGKTDDLFCFIGQPDLEEVDASEKTAKAILGDHISEPASYAVTDVKESKPVAEEEKPIGEQTLDSAAKQKLAHMKAEKPVIKQVNQEDTETETEKAQVPPVDGPSRKHGGGTLKAVVEDLGPPKVKSGGA